VWLIGLPGGQTETLPDGPWARSVHDETTVTFSRRSHVAIFGSRHPRELNAQPKGGGGGGASGTSVDGSRGNCPDRLRLPKSPKGATQAGASAELTRFRREDALSAGSRKSHEFLINGVLRNVTLAEFALWKD